MLERASSGLQLYILNVLHLLIQHGDLSAASPIVLNAQVNAAPS